MTPAENGYFTHEGPGGDGLRYAYLLDNGQERPDPASRWQPEGVSRPSAVFDAAAHAWSDAAWPGVPRDDLAIYELHVGTFSPDGTFTGVIPRLSELAELGFTAIEIMPVAQFSGERNWGYDGVHLYATQSSYGGPRELQRLVDAAHQAGLAVILDVVYNHLGPEGNYLREFGAYFTDRYHTPWGAALNYDGPDCEPVRQLMCENARLWVRDFHFDGLRLDATMMMYDLGARHILAEIAQAAREEGARAGRVVHIIAETDQNDMRIVNSVERGGYGLDGIWADDFHHALHALLTGERDRYYQGYGQPDHVAKAFADVFVYDGCYSPWRRRRHGSSVGDASRSHFVVCTKNHDLIGNRPLGDRPATYLPPAALRIWAALLLLHPGVPLVFMGEEYGERRPFPFFCSFSDPRLIEAVRQGRKKELSFAKLPGTAGLPDPQDAATFNAAKLSWQWTEPIHAGLRRLYQKLLAARRTWPALQDKQSTRARIIAGTPLLMIERGPGQEILACANLGAQAHSFRAEEVGSRQLLLSTEQPEFAGGRMDGAPPSDVLGYEVLVFGRSR
jgi:maltooligosyltrehalose trehalohydrolase